MKKHPAGPAPTVSATPATPAPLPGCGWEVVTDASLGTVTAESIDHVVTYSVAPEALGMIPTVPMEWQVHNDGNGLSFMLEGESDDGSIMGAYGRWAGWRADGPFLLRGATFTRLDDGTFELHPREDRYHLEQGTIVLESHGGALFYVATNTTGAARGTVLFLSGLDAGKYTKKLPEILAEQGWAVAMIYNIPVGLDSFGGIDVSEDPPPGEVGREVAAWLEERHCNIVGAADAALAMLNRQDPALPNKPLVIVGASAGALYVPGLAASLERQSDASVLITGGANMFRVILDSHLVRWNGANGTKTYLDDNADAIDAAFLEASPRDPFNTAPLLDRERTLIIHARDDGFVPHETGDTLWERAGRPERWVYPGGHVGFFLTFGSHADDIAEWIDEKVPSTAAQANGQTPGRDDAK